MSASICEAVIAALVTALNTSRPVGVPTFERDRWVDVEAGPSTMPVAIVAGYKDEPLPEQDGNRMMDLRRVRVAFELYTIGGGSFTASAAADEIVQWIGTKCGVELSAGLVSAGAHRITLEERVAVVAKGNVCRCSVELLIEYRNLINDLTRTK